MEKLEDLEGEHKNPSKEGSGRWRSALTIVENRGQRFRDVAELYKRFEAEKKKHKIQKVASNPVEHVCGRIEDLDDETKAVVESSETVNSHHINIGEVNGTGDHRLHETGRRNTARRSRKDDGTEHNVESSKTGNLDNINIGEEDGTKHHKLPEGRNTWSSWKEVLEKIFVITNFLLELLSAVFDQLSSVHKPQYALLSMLMSFAAILLCAVELFYKARKDKVTWKFKSTLIPWLYYPLQPHKPFGNFKDIIGFVCALCQCILTTVGFVFVGRHAANPIKFCVWPVLFAFGLVCSKFF